MSLKCNLSLKDYINICVNIEEFWGIETYECAPEDMKKVNVKEYKKKFPEDYKSAKKMTPEKRLKNLFSVAGIENIELLIRLLIDKNIIEEKDLRDFINKNFAYFIADEMHNDEKAINAMNLVFEEVHNKRGVDFSDIKFLDAGSYKSVYILETEKDKVIIKMGLPRHVREIPYIPEALYPVFHRIINPEFEIEITEFAENVKITKEMAYQFYKRIRDKGIILTDIIGDWYEYTCENFGRLTKDNCIHYIDPETGKPIYVDPRSVGFIYDPEFDEIESLGEGELILRDNDFVYSCNVKPEGVVFSESKRFEERYQKEKKQEERKKLIKNLKEKEKLLKKFTKIKKATFNWRQEYGNRESATPGYGSGASSNREHVDR